MLKIMDLRKSFIEFFRERNHKIIPSSSLLPKDDPTLLFTTAGMVQFKPMFAGTVKLEFTRAATVQKCLRTSDLENVGKTKRHLTFFEMLGNFSFGDYFKVEAIEFAWEYSINVIGFPKERIWVSVYEDDNEAYDIWKNYIGIPEHKIIRLGREDNFWGPAGDSGACGPCSELYLDRGEEFGCGSDSCKPGCNCERFLEYWNLVFNQYNQDVSGNLTTLPKTGIDTGMGLERLATLVQNVDSVFETDELQRLVQFVSNESGVKYEGKNITPIRILVEHSRALTFALADGIYPSNEGRGYVLRRILRRGLRYSRQIGVVEPFLYKIVDPIVDIMGDFYPEIRNSSKNVKSVIESEEKRFLETLENGMDRFEEIMKSVKKNGEKVIPGYEAFILYDTFGFPFEMTLEIAQEQGLDVDVKGYENAMEEQRERGKQSWKGVDADHGKAFEGIARVAEETIFKGYIEEKTESKIQVIHNFTNISDVLHKSEKGLIVLHDTPFYGESGGQVGDKGEIVSGSGARFRVDDTKKFNKIIIHIGEVVKGEFRKGETVIARIDVLNRNLIRANHTATHLLQAALRKVLGDHIKQSGSYVAPDRMRFDFSHFNALTEDELTEIETIVNNKIWEGISVNTDIMNIDDAIAKGAMAVFDEKYEDIVRVIQVDDFSMELCGGTHVANTGQIGVFKILKEASPGAGIRRIEAVTLKGLYDRYNSFDDIITKLTKTLNVTETSVVKKIDDVIEFNRSLEKELEKYKKESLSSEIDTLISNAVIAKDVKIISHVFKGIDIDALRGLSDTIRSREQNSVIFFGSDNDGKALLLFAATNNGVKKGIDCGAIIKDVSKIVSGGGGGKKDMAQAGGKSPEFLDKAINEAVKITSKIIK